MRSHGPFVLVTILFSDDGEDRQQRVYISSTCTHHVLDLQ